MTTSTSDCGGDPPQGDPTRQAVASLRGYAYQVTAAALAWLELDEDGRLYLEVAEDYATVAKDALAAFQVKDTAATATVTLRSAAVREALASFVDLVGRNPALKVSLHFLTTSEIGSERALADRPVGEAGLSYWRCSAAGGEVAPLRAILEGEGFPETVQAFVRARSDDAVRADLLCRVHWDCGKPDLANLRSEFEARLVVVCRDKFGIAASEASAFADALIHRVLLKATADEGAERFLCRADLYSAIDSAALISLPRKAVEDLLLNTSSALAFKDMLPPLLLENLALRFGLSHPAPEPDELVAYLKAKAEEFSALQARFAQIEGIAGDIEKLVASAQAALEAGDFQLTDQHLQKAEEILLRSATLVAVAKQSELRVARAQAALLSGNVVLAASHWAAAASYFEAFDRNREAETRSEACLELRGYGYRYGNVAALLAAEAALLRNQEIWTRETNLRGWCQTTNALGNTRWRLAQFDGIRFEHHIKGAEEALEAVRSACSKTVLPYFYAISSGNLANINSERRQSKSDKEYMLRIRTGISLQSQAVEALSKDKYPEEYGIFQHNLGMSYTALSRLLEREEEKREALHKSIVHLERSFEVRGPDETLQYWVASARSLAEALIDRALIESGDARLHTVRRARTLLDTASAKIGEAEHPNQWAELNEQLRRVSVIPLPSD